MIELTLPFPPTVNTIWRRVGNRTVLSRRGRQFRSDAMEAIAEQWQGQALTGRLAVKLVLIPPTLQARDIDNYSKGVLDAITHAGVWLDDGQVDQLTIIRGEKAKGGGCWVEIVEIAEAA